MSAAKILEDILITEEKKRAQNIFHLDFVPGTLRFYGPNWIQHKEMSIIVDAYDKLISSVPYSLFPALRREFENDLIPV